MSLPRFQFTGNDGKQVAGEVLLHDARTLRLRVDTVAGKRLRKPFEEHGPADDLPKGWMMETLTRAPARERYNDFLGTKRIAAPPCGFETDPNNLHPQALPIQIKTAHWALWRGRADALLSTGLGKTLIELIFCEQVAQRTGKRSLIVAPLGVSAQTVREGAKFGIGVTRCRTPADVDERVCITNYERLHLFDPDQFQALAIDEAGILKGGGPVANGIIEFGRRIPYRLGATATPAPNETMELVNHASYLGIMEPRECMATFFQQDGNTTNKWRLKTHAKRDFWDWVSTWAAACRKPSDWGLSDAGYELPALEVIDHDVNVPFGFGDEQGFLFAPEAKGMGDQRKVRKHTLEERCGLAAEISKSTNGPVIVWTDLNPESELCTKLIGADAVEVTGSQKDDDKEARLTAFSTGNARVIVTKPRIGGWGLNWQHCGTQVFVGRGNSFESDYQCVRRSWRFGRKDPVTIHRIGTDADGHILRNMLRKTMETTELMDELIAAVQRNGLVCQEARRDEWNYAPQEAVKLPHWL